MVWAPKASAPRPAGPPGARRAASPRKPAAAAGPAGPAWPVTPAPAATHHITCKFTYQIPRTNTAEVEQVDRTVSKAN